MPHNVNLNVVTGSSMQPPLLPEDMQASLEYANNQPSSQHYGIHGQFNRNPVSSLIPNMGPSLSQVHDTSSMHYQQVDTRCSGLTKQGSKRHTFTSNAISAYASDPDNDDGGELPSSGLIAPLEVLRTLADMAMEQAAKVSSIISFVRLFNCLMHALGNR